MNRMTLYMVVVACFICLGYLIGLVWWNPAPAAFMFGITGILICLTDVR
jgi:UDP-N-acetylmuramyl pentapeptide phosphotransferase/UDP-N-acetylglucosamine-1-phosphate transferase